MSTPLSSDSHPLKHQPVEGADTGRAGLFNRSKPEPLMKRLEATLTGDLETCKTYVSSQTNKLSKENISDRTVNSHLGHAVIKGLLAIPATLLGFIVSKALLLPLIGGAIALTSLFKKDPDKKAERLILGARVATWAMMPGVALFKAAYEDFKMAQKKGQVKQVTRDIVSQAKREINEAKHDVKKVGRELKQEFNEGVQSTKSSLQNAKSNLQDAWADFRYWMKQQGN